MFSLSLLTQIESNIKQLRNYIIFLLAGNREHERSVWNLLLLLTNSFCDPEKELSKIKQQQKQKEKEKSETTQNNTNNKKEEEGETTKTVLVDLAERNAQTAFICWDQYAGDILLGLLVLAGEQDGKWDSFILSSTTTENCEEEEILKNISKQKKVVVPIEIPSLAQSRIYRFLSPKEKLHCRVLFFHALFPSIHNCSSSSSSIIFIKHIKNRIEAILPLLVSFSPLKQQQKQKQEEETEVANSSSWQIPATSRTLRSVVAACISTFATQDLHALINCVVSEKISEQEEEGKKEEAKYSQNSGLMMESGFRIAEVLASPPVQHGMIVIDFSNNVSSKRKWQKSVSATDVVKYFSSLLKQIGNDIFLLLAPSNKNFISENNNSNSNSNNKLGIESTRVRTLCACLFLVGRLALNTTNTNSNSNNNNKSENSSSSTHLLELRSALSNLSLPRLSLIDKDFLGPSFGCLKKFSNLSNVLEQVLFSSSSSSETSASSSSEKVFTHVTNSLKKLESLLFALRSVPMMVLSCHVEKSILAVVSLVWDKVGDCVSKLAFLQVADAGTSTTNQNQNQEQREEKEKEETATTSAFRVSSSSSSSSYILQINFLARSCLRLILLTISDRTILKRRKRRMRKVQQQKQENHDNNDSNNNNKSKKENDDSSSSYLDLLLIQPIIDALTNLVGEKEENENESLNLTFISNPILLVESLLELVSPSMISSSSSSNYFTNPEFQNEQEAIICSEIFKVAVSIQQQNRFGKDSVAEKSYTMFLMGLLSRVSIVSIFSSSASSESNSPTNNNIDEETAIEILEQLLRFCVWTLKTFSSSSSKNKTQQQMNNNEESSSSSSFSFTVTIFKLLETLPPLDDIIISAASVTSSSSSSSYQSKRFSQEVSTISDLIEKLIEFVSENFPSALKKQIENENHVFEEEEEEEEEGVLNNNSNNNESILLYAAANCLRNLHLLRGSCTVLSLNDVIEGENDNNKKQEEGSSTTENIKKFLELFKEIKNLFERKLWSALSVSLMDLSYFLHRYYSSLITRRRERNRRIDSSYLEKKMEKKEGEKEQEQEKKQEEEEIKIREIISKEMKFLVEDIICRNSIKKSSSSTNNTSSLGGGGSLFRNSSRMIQQQQQQNNNNTQSSFFKNKKPFSTTTRRNNSNAATNNSNNSEDDSVVAAASSLVASISLMRLDYCSSTQNQSSSKNLFLRNTLCSSLQQAISNPTNESIAKAAATMLDIVVRITDDDIDGLTIRNIFFSIPEHHENNNNENNDDNNFTTTWTAEQLCLQLVRAVASSSSSKSTSKSSAASAGTTTTTTVTLVYQALRLCCLHVLGKCYSLVPTKCNFDLVEDLIVGIFRSPGEIFELKEETNRSGEENKNNNDNDKNDNDNANNNDEQKATQQLLRLAGSALLSNIVPAIAKKQQEEVAARKNNDTENENEHDDNYLPSSSSTLEKNISVIRRLSKLCEHISQYRSFPVGQLFDEEIREHGKIALKNLREICPDAMQLIELQGKSS